MMDEQSVAAAFTVGIYLGLPVLVLCVGWLIGHITETEHEKSLKFREEALKDVEVTTIRLPPGFSASDGSSALVCGEVVIASDAFKSLLFKIRNVLGGESTTFTRLFDRARREALLRMKEQALQLGFDSVCNVRYDSADIGGNASSARGKRAANMAVAMVTGTAWRRHGS